MTREQEATILDAWQTGGGGKKQFRSEDYLEFYDTVIRRTKHLRRLHVFEVLDVVVNAEHLAQESRRTA